MKEFFIVITLISYFSPLFASGQDRSDLFDWNSPIAVAYDLSEEISAEGLMIGSLEEEGAETIAYADSRRMLPKDKIVNQKSESEETAAFIRRLVNDSNVTSHPAELNH